ncbi:MAG: hypothetical protein AAF488_15500, partial [Planctomycetota bacterium]
MHLSNLSGQLTAPRRTPSGDAEPQSDHAPYSESGDAFASLVSEASSVDSNGASPKLQESESLAPTLSDDVRSPNLRPSSNSPEDLIDFPKFGTPPDRASIAKIETELSLSPEQATVE